MTAEEARKIVEKKMTENPQMYLSGEPLTDDCNETDYAFHFYYKTFVRMNLTKMELVPVPDGYITGIALIKTTGEVCPLPQ